MLGVIKGIELVGPSIGIIEGDNHDGMELKMPVGNELRIPEGQTIEPIDQFLWII